MGVLVLDDEYFMGEALKEANCAKDLDEVPIGAVIVLNDRIISRAYNLTQKLNDVTAHAEMQAITSASEAIGGKYLRDCTLYVTIEPCPMCASALYWAQIGRVVFGAKDKKRGAGLFEKNLYHPRTKITHGVLEDKCSELVVEYFREKRKKY
ncbi:MAG: nucleoside deaminase [Bacteroidales bacterium]|nr:nucleoside deaminase [Bacteroidales bacterium]